MPRPLPSDGIQRHRVTVRLSDEEERPVRELAATMPRIRGNDLNLSAAARRIIREWADLHPSPEPEQENPEP